MNDYDVSKMMTYLQNTIRHHNYIKLDEIFSYNYDYTFLYDYLTDLYIKPSKNQRIKNNIEKLIE
jgi:hypothetical protein